MTSRAVIAFIVVGVTELCGQLIPMAMGESLSGLTNIVNHCNAAPLIPECRTPFPSSSCNPATHKPRTSLSLPFFLSCSQTQTINEKCHRNMPASLIPECSPQLLLSSCVAGALSSPRHLSEDQPCFSFTESGSQKMYLPELSYMVQDSG